MGTFTAKLRVWNPVKPEKKAELDVWVDTGAAYSWVSRSRLEGMDIGSVRRMQFRTIEGNVVERDLAAVFVATDGYSGGDSIVLAEPGDMEVMGAHSLESLGLTVDPVRKTLIPTIGLALAAAPFVEAGSRLVNKRINQF